MSQFTAAPTVGAPTDIPTDAPTTLDAMPAVFSYTPTGRAIPASAPPRAPAPRATSPSCTPTGRIVAAAPSAPSAPTATPAKAVAAGRDAAA